MVGLLVRFLFIRCEDSLNSLVRCAHSFVCESSQLVNKKSYALTNHEVISMYNTFIFIDCKICYHCVLKLRYITQEKGEFDNALSIGLRIEMEQMYR